METIITGESVAPCHPEKIADQISDAILDQCLQADPNTRAGNKVMANDNIVVLDGEYR